MDNIATQYALEKAQERKKKLKLRVATLKNQVEKAERELEDCVTIIESIKSGKTRTLFEGGQGNG